MICTATGCGTSYDPKVTGGRCPICKATAEPPKPEPLERIAAALERIADALEGPRELPWPEPPPRDPDLDREPTPGTPALLELIGAALRRGEIPTIPTEEPDA